MGRRRGGARPSHRSASREVRPAPMSRRGRVEVALNFERNLEEIEAWLTERDAASDFVSLLDELFERVVPNLPRTRRRLPGAPRRFRRRRSTDRTTAAAAGQGHVDARADRRRLPRPLRNACRATVAARDPTPPPALVRPEGALGDVVLVAPPIPTAAPRLVATRSPDPIGCDPDSGLQTARCVRATARCVSQRSEDSEPRSGSPRSPIRSVATRSGRPGAAPNPARFPELEADRRPLRAWGPI